MSADHFRWESTESTLPTGGGRVTELVAKPLISLLFPDLSGVDQPLAGETALRSEVLDEIELAGGYGVETELLIDVWQRWGNDTIAGSSGRAAPPQPTARRARVAGTRGHRHRPRSGDEPREVAVTKLQRLYEEQGQSPWLDNLTRPYLRDGTVARYVTDGIRGVTANPTIFARAIEGSDAYDSQFGVLIVGGCTVGEAYWRLVIDDVAEALGRGAPARYAGRRDGSSRCGPRARRGPSTPNRVPVPARCPSARRVRARSRCRLPSRRPRESGDLRSSSPDRMTPAPGSTLAGRSRPRRATGRA
jgi:hypothetical protein